jgi:hypothetical protein
VSSRIPAIQEFPQDDQIWRVDFFGGIQRNSSIPDEPTIQIILSPLANPNNKDPKELASVKAVTHELRRTIHIGVG